MRAWDFLHCPAGTEHVFVGAGDGPCAILMIGSRRPDVPYPVSQNCGALRRLGAQGHVRSEAYADWSEELVETRLTAAAAG